VALRRRAVPFAVCTVVQSAGSSPRKHAAKMLVGRDGWLFGTVGGGAIELEVIDAAIACIGAGADQLVERHLVHDLAMCCGGAMKVFVEVQSYATRCLVFGCGHVGQPLAELAARCGFATTAIDERSAFADPARFPPLPGLAVVCDDLLGALEDLVLRPSDFVVVATHDHGLDEAVVAAVLAQPPAYLGCIGSVRKGLMFRQRLAARGLPAEAIDLMRTPMGLDLGAETPDEIAVSVVAQMVAVRRGHE
jgi:xanthine dehydrogenase accessory factor